MGNNNNKERQTNNSNNDSDGNRNNNQPRAIRGFAQSFGDLQQRVNEANTMYVLSNLIKYIIFTF